MQKIWTGASALKNLLKISISKSTIIKYKWELLFLLATTFIHLLILILPTQLAFGDLAPFPESWSKGFTDFIFAWRDIAFGVYRHPGNITILLQSLMVLFFGSALIAQKVYVIYLLPFIAFWSSRYLLKKHFAAKNDSILFLTTFFYTYSPTMLTEFVGGTQYSTMLFFSFFPLLTALTLNIIVAGKRADGVVSSVYKSSLGLLLLLSLLLSINVQVLLIYGIFFGIALIFSSSKKLNNRIIHIIKKGIIVSIIIVLAMIANPIYTLSNFTIINPTPQIESDAGFINSYSTFLNDVKYTYSRSSFLNTIRLGGNLSDFKYTRLTYWTIPFLLLSVITLLYSIYSFSKADNVTRIFYAGYILVSLFIYLTYLEYTHSIFLNFPVLFVFRNPAKLTLLNTVFFYVCLFNALRSLGIFLKRFNLTKLFYIGTFITVIMYIWPIFLADRGLAATREDFSIPHEYYTINEVIKNDAKSNEPRTIWLPSTYERHSIKLTWIDRTRVEDQLGLNEFSTDNFGSNIVKSINNSIVDDDKELFNKLLTAANVQYIILTKDKETSTQFNEFYDVSSLQSGYMLLDRFLSDNNVIYDSQYYKVYKLDTTPLLYSVTKINEINFKIGSSRSILNDYYKNYSLPLVKKNSQVADIITAKTDNDDLSAHVLEWNDDWTWPKPGLNPNNPLINVLMYKEQVGFNWRNDPITRINFATWIIANRAAAIQKYNSRGAALEKVTDNINFYNKYIYDFYSKNEIKNDLDRDTAVKAIVFLSRSQKNMGISSNVLDDTVALISNRINEGYKNLCITNCVKVTADIEGTYQPLIDRSRDYQLIKGSNVIEISPENDILAFSTAPSTSTGLVLEIDNLSINKKYLLEFDYETNDNFYELSLFNQFKNFVNYRYDYDVYIEQILTSDVSEVKHFRTFFTPKNHPESKNIFKVEVAGKTPDRNINITNFKLAPLPTRSLSLINSNVKIDTSTGTPKNVEFIKNSPIEYKIKSKDIGEYLVFAQNYNIGWKIYKDDGTQLTNTQQQLYNTYGNIWKLNKEDIKDTEFITLKFTPQKQLELSLIFTGLFFTFVSWLLVKTYGNIIK